MSEEVTTSKCEGWKYTATFIAFIAVMIGFLTYVGDCRAPLKKWFLPSCADYRARR